MFHRTGDFSKQLKCTGTEKPPHLSLIFVHFGSCHQDDEEPKDHQFDVDGKYFPRVFFLGEYLIFILMRFTRGFHLNVIPFPLLFVIIDHEGKVQKELHNNDPEYIKYKFFYNDDEEREYYLIFLISFFLTFLSLTLVDINGHVLNVFRAGLRRLHPFSWCSWYV